MTEVKFRVRRSRTPRASLFGPTHWWDVWATPFQDVASFSRWDLAVEYAILMTVGMRAKEKKRDR